MLLVHVPFCAKTRIVLASRHVFAGGPAHTSGALEQPVFASHAPVWHVSTGAHEVPALYSLHGSRSYCPHFFHVRPEHVASEHSSVHVPLHTPFVHVWPDGQSTGGPQPKHPFASKWPHVTVPAPEHCVSPSLHSSWQGPGRHAPFEHIVPSAQASSANHCRHVLEPM
jgi:hypothetical protein